MRKSLISIFWSLLLICTACEDEETIYRIDPESGGQNTYIAPNDITLQMNRENISNYACDGTYDYFQYYEEGYLRLYKKHRKSGELTILDQRQGPASSTTDVVYTNFYLLNGYLYFMLFDANNQDWRYTLCRVATKGNTPIEKVTDLKENFGRLFYANGKAYSNFRDAESQTDKVYEINLSDGNLTYLFDIDIDSYLKLFTNGYFYYQTYHSENGFHTVLKRCRMDGSEKQTIVDNPDFRYLFPTILNNRLYLHNSTSLYSAAMDGSDLRLEIKDVPANSLNVGRDAIYMLLQGSEQRQEGLYTYKPGYKRPMPLYLGLGDDSWYLMLNGYEEFILPVRTSASRFGQLQVIRGNNKEDIKQRKP